MVPGIHAPYPDGSQVYTRYPLPDNQEDDREYWAWMPGTIAGRCAPDEWLIFVEHPMAAEFNEEGELYYPGVFRDSSEISHRDAVMTGDKTIRSLTAAVVLAVAAFAAVVSYSHIYDLGRAHGQSVLAARLLPLSVDGLILAASLVALHEARRRHSVPPLARCMLVLGVGATVTANVAYGAPYGPVWRDHWRMARSGVHRICGDVDGTDACQRWPIQADVCRW
jgi:hypothetical protein